MPWIEVASSGSRKAEERPRATQLPIQRPVEAAGVDADVVARLDRVAEGGLDLGLRLVRGEVEVGVDVAAAVAARGRDLPQPARALRPGEGEGVDLLARRDVEPERHGAVDRQDVGVGLPVAPISVISAAAEAGAVEEEVARRPRRRLRGARAVMSPVSASRSDGGDLVVDHGDAGGLAAQEGADLRPGRSGRRGGTARAGRGGRRESAKGLLRRSIRYWNRWVSATGRPCGDLVGVEEGGAAVAAGRRGAGRRSGRRSCGRAGASRGGGCRT